MNIRVYLLILLFSTQLYSCKRNTNDITIDKKNTQEQYLNILYNDGYRFYKKINLFDRIGEDSIDIKNKKQITTYPFYGFKIDIKKRRPVFDNVYAGLSGPAIKPIALKMVREVAKAVKVPVIGMGGITTAEDAIEFIMAGAHLIQFGTASFINPYAGKDIVEGIEAFMKEENIKSLDEIRGII